MRKKLFTLLLAFALVISMNTWANNTKAEDKIRITFEAQTVKAGTESNVKIESTDDVTISSVYWAQKTYGFNDFATGNEIHQSIDVDPDTDTGIFYPVHEGEGWIEIHYKQRTG